MKFYISLDGDEKIYSVSIKDYMSQAFCDRNHLYSFVLYLSFYWFNKKKPDLYNSTSKISHHLEKEFT